MTSIKYKAPVDNSSHLLQLLHTLLVILIGGVRVAAPQNRVLEPAPELVGRAEDTLIDKMDKGKVLE